MLMLVWLVAHFSLVSSSYFGACTKDIGLNRMLLSRGSFFAFSSVDVAVCSRRVQARVAYICYPFLLLEAPEKYVKRASLNVLKYSSFHL
jgi:hypothetical protein